MLHAKSVSAFWDKFRSIQNQADLRRVDHQAWAIDEVVSEYLERLDATDPDLKPLTDEEIEQLPGAFRLRVWNKKKKHRRRRRIVLTRLPRETGRPVVDVPDPSKFVIDHARNDLGDDLDRKSAAAAVRASVTEQEWKLLWARANDRSFEELSIEWGEAVGTLKSRVARCRRRLRHGYRTGVKRSVGTRD
jgi:hypothetical protein